MFRGVPCDDGHGNRSLEGSEQIRCQRQVIEPQYVNSFYALTPNGNFIDLEYKNVVLRPKSWAVPGYASFKTVADFEPSQSPIRLPASAQFAVRGRANVNPATLYELRLLKGSKSHREFVMSQAHGSIVGGAVNPEEGAIPIRFEQYGTSSFRIIPEQPLARRRRSRVDSQYETGRRVALAGDSGRGTDRRFVRRRLHSRGAGHQSQSLCGVHVEHCGGSGAALALFALASLLNRFRYLHYGLAALLGFVALKMLGAHWIEVPITISLAVMGAILTICAVVSWMASARDQRSEIGDR